MTSLPRDLPRDLPSDLPSYLPSWPRAFAFCLLLVQLVLVSTWVMEGVQGIGSRAHVESPAAATHHAHDEAECPSCTGRSIHANAPAPAPPAIRSSSSHAIEILATAERPSRLHEADHPSRAPPAPIAGPML